MNVRSYKPQVDCDPRPLSAPSEASCNRVLSTLPATRNKYLFGPTGSGGYVKYKLPVEFRLRKWDFVQVPTYPKISTAGPVEYLTSSTHMDKTGLEIVLVSGSHHVKLKAF